MDDCGFVHKPIVGSNLKKEKDSRPVPLLIARTAEIEKSGKSAI